jgi:hypothetical protein
MNEINFAYPSYTRNSHLGRIALLAATLLIALCTSSYTWLRYTMRSVNHEITNLEAKIALIKKSAGSACLRKRTVFAKRLEQVVNLPHRNSFFVQEIEICKNSCLCTISAKNSAELAQASQIIEKLHGVKESCITTINRNNDVLNAQYTLTWKTKEAS